MGINKDKDAGWKCVECGAQLTFIQEFQDAGLPCNRYCCGCCPDRRTQPCAKDRFEGSDVPTMLSELQNWK